MRILLDECLPRRLKRVLGRAPVVRTVPEAGWSGKTNGELLKLASVKFDVFITIDQNLAGQAHHSEPPLTIIILTARSNRLEDLLPLMPQVLIRLRNPAPHRIIRIGV